jgi:hypothetical protein
MPRLTLPTLGLAMLALAAAAFGQGLTCEDIEFLSNATDEFPAVAQTCQSVVERSDGRLYVRLVADIVRTKRDGSILLDFKAKDGSIIRQEFAPASGFRAIISGVPTHVRHLARGQEIRIYLPPNRWRVRSTTE